MDILILLLSMLLLRSVSFYYIKTGFSYRKILSFGTYQSVSFMYYSSIASTGQVAAQAPHSKHAVSSISYLPSPSAIAPTGHASAQLPQERHASVILYAIVVSSCFHKVRIQHPPPGSSGKGVRFYNLILIHTSLYCKQKIL